MDANILLDKKHKLDQLKSSIDEDVKMLFASRKNTSTSLKNINEKYKDKENIREITETLGTIFNVSNGKGKTKMDLKTYVQRRYFQKIIKNANRRLIKMNNGDFTLQCKDIEDLSSQGKVGLDMDVFSIINNQSRDVSSLSGGETFMAALALALGMSEVIQNEAGNIKIDMLFIDEGFGSLSDDVRNEAIKVLNELSNGK